MSKPTAELAIRVSAELPSHGLLVAKHRASGSRFRDQSVLLVGYFALHIAHRAAALHDPSLRCEPSRPYRSKEIDFQLDGSEGFLRRKSACECLPLAASAMSHRIPPCSGPMGFACRGSAEKVAVARPLAISFASKPIRRATATSFDFACSLKSGWSGVPWVVVMTSPPVLSAAVP